MNEYRNMNNYGRTLLSRT